MENKNIKILVIALVCLIVIAGILLGIKFVMDSKKIQQGEMSNTQIIDDIPEVPNKSKTVKIYAGVDRPIAVMIDNHKSAWPQAGINEAYMVYEIIVEGGETRLMALFKGQNLEKIGPIRSSRHYFLDYALENDAIYVHYGWSPQAQSDISSLKVNNINGISESSKDFWRVKDKSAPHNAVTSTQNILNMAKRKGYRTTSSDTSVLKYTTEDVILENGQDAYKVTIPYSTSNDVMYNYNQTTKRYERYAKNKQQTEWDTNEIISTKNIIITFVANYTLDDPENKGRQGIKNIGTSEGYYITNGKAIKITCTKNSRTGKTIYKDLEGNEIKVNDGNTFVQICPIDAQVKIEGI